MTALLKPNGRIRGISAADVFRRLALVSKTIARQEQETLREAVAPFKFGLCDTDALVHLLQFLSDMHPDKVVMSIERVGAFDHVCRTWFFEQLSSIPALHSLIPYYVRQWYSAPSLLTWPTLAP